MLLKRILLYNFKNFSGENEFLFDKLNVITGRNGSGKSTLIKDSLLFCLYGFSDNKLSSLITRGKKSCKVTCYIDDYIISREQPTNVTIYKNDKEIDLETNRKKQEYINKIFGNVDFFRKFRILDINQGINILEEGKTKLRKTLFSLHDHIFNKVRDKLQAEKREKEVFNKSNIESYPHYPSNKRKKLLEVKILELSESMYNLDSEIREMDRDYYNLVSNKASNDKEISIYKSNKDRIFSYSECPTCKRKMNRQTKMSLNNEINEKLSKLYDIVKDLNSELEDQKDILEHLKKSQNKVIERKNKLNNLKMKLESRLKQKKYIYDEKDLEIMKQAIKELDNFSSYYITEWIKILEPIINDIINCIDFNVKFNLDDKGNLNMVISRGGKDFSYSDLSSGERLIFFMAFNLSILLEKNETGLIIADEGLNVLDQNNLSNMLDLFQNNDFQLACVVQRYEPEWTGKNLINLGEYHGCKN